MLKEIKLTKAQIRFLKPKRDDIATAKVALHTAAAMVKEYNREMWVAIHAIFPELPAEETGKPYIAVNASDKDWTITYWEKD